LPLFLIVRRKQQQQINIHHILEGTGHGHWLAGQVEGEHGERAQRELRDGQRKEGRGRIEEEETVESEGRGIRTSSSLPYETKKQKQETWADTTHSQLRNYELYQMTTQLSAATCVPCGIACTPEVLGGRWLLSIWEVEDVEVN
jgi:hypothetical protein